MASPAQAGSLALLADRPQQGIAAWAGRLVMAGVLNALIAAFLLCHLPNAPAPTLPALVERAFFYVCAAALAGMAGVGFYWRRSADPYGSSAPRSFALFVLTNAAGWVWAPSVVFLSRQDSLATAPMAGLGAALLATGLRKAMPCAANPLHQRSSGHEWAERELFADSLRTPPREAHGYVIALCIYLAAFALLAGENLTACIPLALCAFLTAWKLTLAPEPNPDSTQINTRAALCLARIAAAAVLVTAAVLFVGVASRNRAAAVLAHGSGPNQGDDSSQSSTHPAQDSAFGISGYESIILWPVPEKKQIVPPLPAQDSLLARGTTRPLVIRFDGPYWYFQPPGKRPGPQARQAQGSPLAYDIEAHNFIPLTMEAHQSLGRSIRISRCREIQVAVLNRDNHPGRVNLAVLLTDSASRATPALYLGQQPLVSSLPGHFAIKSSAAGEVLRFPIAAPTKIRKFDKITVMFLPDGENFQAGPKVAIQQFELLPR
jgi:hypothetical protein